MNLSDQLKKLKSQKDLTSAEMREFFDGVYRGIVTQEQAGDMLKALAEKGESPSEILGVIEEMRFHLQADVNSQMVNAPDAIDIVGTGGDGSGTFNISTAAAFVAVGAGAKVAKHGNRAASSKCGSADVLEELGVNITLTPEQAGQVYRSVGMVFLMAPTFHPEMKAFAAVRKGLGIRTIFNIVGPFTNPAFTERQLVGVANKEIAEKMLKAATLLNHKFKRIIIVTSDDGMDEISLFAKTQAYEIHDGKVKEFTIDPKEFAFEPADKKDILGGSAGDNARIIRDILEGTKSAARDIVVLNTAYALIVAGIAKTPEEGIVQAEKSIDSGAARQALENLIRESNAV